MENQSTINLIRDRNEIPEYIQPVQAQFRNFSLLALIVTVVAGVATLAVYLSFQVALQAQTVRKNSLTRRLEELKTEETVYLTVKSRLPIVEKALAAGRPMNEIIRVALNTQPPPGLRSVSFSQEGKAVMQISANTLEESMEIANRFLIPYPGLTVAEPYLSSFSMDEKGTSLSFSFKPVWEEIVP